MVLCASLVVPSASPVRPGVCGETTLERSWLGSYFFRRQSVLQPSDNGPADAKLPRVGQHPDPTIPGLAGTTLRDRVIDDVGVFKRDAQTVRQPLAEADE